MKAAVMAIATSINSIKCKMSKLECNQKIIIEMLQTLNKNQNTGTQEQILDIPFEIVEFNTGIKFPLKGLDELRSLEARLSESATLKAVLIQQFSQYGGKNIKFCTRTLMAKLFDDELLEQFSWQGHKKKMAFQELVMSEIVCDVVRINYPAATNAEISCTVKTWMVKAKERIERKAKKCGVPGELNVTAEKELGNS